VQHKCRQPSQARRRSGEEKDQSHRWHIGCFSRHWNRVGSHVVRLRSSHSRQTLRSLLVARGWHRRWPTGSSCRTCRSENPSQIRNFGKKQRQANNFTRERSYGRSQTDDGKGASLPIACGALALFSQINQRTEVHIDFEQNSPAGGSSRSDSGSRRVGV